VAQALPEAGSWTKKSPNWSRTLEVWLYDCTMNEQAHPLQAPNSGVNPKEFESFCTTYRQHQDALSLIKQLNQMIKAVQRHRGMSMAILAGSTLFQGDFHVLQRQVERRLTSLEVFAAQTGLLSARDKENLHNAWHTIRADWQGDDVIDNFELHSHFIDQLQIMIAGLAKHLEKPVSVTVAEKANLALPDEDATAYPKMFKQIELLNFAARQVTTMAEQVGRIRALSTYAAAKGLCDYHHDRKLRYAISCARTSNEKLRHQAERLESLLAGALPSLAMIKTYELKLMFLLNTVESDVLSGMTITTNSYNLFKLATEIIDVYLKVVDEAMDLVARWHEEDLESWLCLV
jgi:hypothetical protein